MGWALRDEPSLVRPPESGWIGVEVVYRAAPPPARRAKVIDLATGAVRGGSEPPLSPAQEVEEAVVESYLAATARTFADASASVDRALAAVEALRDELTKPF